MEQLAAFRIFADHYLFFVHDSKAEACPDSFLEIDSTKATYSGSYELGYLYDGKTISFGGCAHLNNYWIELFLSESTPEFGMAERVIALPLEISSGAVSISNTINVEPACSVALSPDQYTVYCLGFSLGKDQSSDIPAQTGHKPLTGNDLFSQQDYEHYQIVFVPGNDNKVTHGVLYGASDLNTARLM